MITILTVFLGLTTGPQPVELATEPPVAQVELFLDGNRVAAAKAPPWRFTVDFGAEPVPHRLAAVGFDDGGKEVARTELAINLRPLEAGIEVVLEPGAGGAPPAARLAWNSADGSAPRRLAAWLDGEPLPVGENRFHRLPLPAVDLAQIHFLTVELEFTGGAVARADHVFGGTHGREIATRNTAVAIEPEPGRRRRLRSSEAARGLVLAGGEPAEPLAVEDGAADVVIVRERSAAAELRLLRAHGSLSEEFGTGGVYGRRGDRFFLVAPAPRVRPTRRGLHEVYQASPGLPGASGNLLFWLIDLPFDPVPEAGQEVTGAVAMAGMLAASGGRPRTVLLLLGPEAPPQEPGDAVRARRFLASLGVPLRVWYVHRETVGLTAHERARARQAGVVEAAEVPAAGRAKRLAAARTAWGEEVEKVGSFMALVEAGRALNRRLGRQQVVWIDGEHLPTEIALAPERGFRLAGRER